MKKLLIYIFIPVLAILLMSHNVFATNTNVVPASVDIYYSIPGTGPISSITLTNLYTPPNFTEMRAWKISESVNINMVCYNLGTTISKNSIFAFSFSSLNTTVGVIGGGPNIKPHSVSVIHEASENTTNVHATSYFVTGHMNNDVNKLCLGDAGNLNSIILYDDGRLNTDMYILQPKINFYDERDQSAEALNDAKQETQDASDNSATAADGNSSSQATSNLLGVFGSFVTALTSISPSNCNVDFDLGHIDFGVQNLCSQPVPQAFTVVTSIIVVCFTIPFVVHLIKRILSLIREMQT